MAKKITTAKSKIEYFFNEYPEKIFKFRELGEVFKANKFKWNLKGSETLNNFILFLSEQSKLKVIEFAFPNRRETRYIWGDFNIYRILIQLNPESYFSHQTAIFLNNLTEQIPKNIYINTEQPPKLNSIKGELLQSNIDLAFRNNPRATNNFAIINNIKVYHINGKSTNNLGVIELEVDDIGVIKVTNLERTLIDATVRPIYSGGVFEILKAFELARPNLSVNKLLSYLKKLDYTYPYHQSIGFYLEKAGYKQSQLSLIKNIPIKYNFYLDYKIEELEFNEDWKIFHPKGL